MIIPRIIHQIWLGSELPRHFRLMTATWRSHNPDWDYRFWTDADLADASMLNDDLYRRARDIVPSGNAVWQFRADILRYAILAEYGGFYADVDTECLQPIDSALSDHETFAAWEDDRWIGNTYLGSKPDHPVMYSILDAIPREVDRQAVKRRPNVLSGPKLITPLWKLFRCYTDSRDNWYPYLYSDVIRRTVPAEYGDAYAVHHWNNTRLSVHRRHHG